MILTKSLKIKFDSENIVMDQTSQDEVVFLEGVIEKQG